jgi:hypothetical protein
MVWYRIENVQKNLPTYIMPAAEIASLPSLPRATAVEAFV